MRISTGRNCVGWRLADDAFPPLRSGFGKHRLWARHNTGAREETGVFSSNASSSLDRQLQVSTSGNTAEPAGPVRRRRGRPGVDAASKLPGVLRVTSLAFPSMASWQL